MATAQTLLASINRNNVIRTYSGKPGCMCGCKGKYYADREDTKDNGGANTVNAKQVSRILTELKGLGDARTVEHGNRGEVIFFVRDDVRHEYRNYVAYVKADGLDLSGVTQ